MPLLILVLLAIAYLDLLHNETSTFSMVKPRAEMTQEELAAKEQEEFNVGPLSILNNSVKNNAQVGFASSFICQSTFIRFLGSYQLQEQ